MDIPGTPTTPPHAIGVRRRLLGIPLTTMAQEAGLSPDLLAAVERGEYDPRSLHLQAQHVLGRVLDLSF
ncbi:helix-turn-helix domain-containing protein [Deinococcus aquatilis]|jgi:predicted transcriptional regulator|uniref:helix-turn-helix domain-containing protein n=1 Tax=Deinococcus aquatilis TaxID=519440 RepID=UPI00036E1658|nr:helix-turn-helix transcriptional regulator [Deinococcus aquatilis]